MKMAGCGTPCPRYCLQISSDAFNPRLLCRRIDRCVGSSLALAPKLFEVAPTIGAPRTTAADKRYPYLINSTSPPHMQGR